MTPHTVATAPLDDRIVDTGSLFHSYSCSKLSFLIKLAFLQSIKDLGYSLPREDLKREEESMEAARIQALETWSRSTTRGSLMISMAQRT